MKTRTRNVLYNELNPSRLAEYINQVQLKDIPLPKAKSVFDQLLTGKPVESIISELRSDNTIDELKSVFDRVINNYPKELQRLSQGEEKLLNFFIGRLMRKFSGKIDPDMVKSTLDKRLENGTS